MTLQGTDPDLPMSVQKSPVEAWVSGGLLQGWGSEYSSAFMGYFEGGRHYPHHRAARTYTGLGNRLLRAQQNLSTRTQEKGVTPQETDPDLPVNVQESLAEAWVGGGLLQGWGH